MRKIPRIALPIAAAVLAVWSERMREKFGRQFVVLFVGLVRQRRNGRHIHIRDEPCGRLGGVFGVVSQQVREPGAQQTPDPAANDAVGHETLFGPVDRVPGGGRETHQ
jgi:hypothetical protein